MVRAGTLTLSNGKSLAVAVKCFADLLPSGEKRVVDRELAALSHATLQCSRVCKFLGTTTKDGFWCIVMKRYEKSLHDLLREAGKMNLADAVDTLKQICLAVADLHESGIVHRDLKPANLLLDKTNQLVMPACHSCKFFLLTPHFR